MLKKFKKCLESMGYSVKEFEPVKFSSGAELKGCLMVENKCYIFVNPNGDVDLLDLDGTLMTFVEHDIFYIMAFELGWVLRNLDV